MARGLPCPSLTRRHRLQPKLTRHGDGVGEEGVRISCPGVRHPPPRTRAAASCRVGSPSRGAVERLQGRQPNRRDRLAGCIGRECRRSPKRGPGAQPTQSAQGSRGEMGRVRVWRLETGAAPAERATSRWAGGGRGSARRGLGRPVQLQQRAARVSQGLPGLAMARGGIADWWWWLAGLADVRGGGR